MCPGNVQPRNYHGEKQLLKFWKAVMVDRIKVFNQTLSSCVLLVCTGHQCNQWNHGRRSQAASCSRKCMMFLMRLSVDHCVKRVTDFVSKLWVLCLEKSEYNCHLYIWNSLWWQMCRGSCSSRMCVWVDSEHILVERVIMTMTKGDEEVVFFLTALAFSQWKTRATDGRTDESKLKEQCLISKFKTDSQITHTKKNPSRWPRG